MNRLRYPVKIMPKHVAIYSQKIIHSDNTWNNLELYRLNYSKEEAQNLTGGLHRDDLATLNC